LELQCEFQANMLGELQREIVQVIDEKKGAEAAIQQEIAKL
jgi:hypothetical protein